VTVDINNAEIVSVKPTVVKTREVTNPDSDNSQELRIEFANERIFFTYEFKVTNGKWPTKNFKFQA